MRKERYLRIREILDRRQPDLTVLMERVHKSHNLAAILRTCDAVGVLGIHAVSAEGKIEPHPATSAGSDRWISVERHPDGPSAIRTLKEAGFQIVAADPGPRSVDFKDVDYTRPTAILMGAELQGVSEHALAAADRTVRIPMVGMVHSLNVSVATALVLYEAFRQRDAAGFYRAPRLDPERRDRLAFEWGYPAIARRLRGMGRPYPALDDEGQIVGRLDLTETGAR